MPANLKKQTASRFVELNLNLKVPRKQHSQVEKALTAILELAGLKAGAEAAVKRKADKAESTPAPKAGRKPKAIPLKPVKAKPAQAKQRPGKAKPAQGRKAAALIRDLRTKAELRQKALADKLGVRPNIISQLETGRQKPNLDMAVKLGQIFKVPYQDLLK